MNDKSKKNEPAIPPGGPRSKDLVKLVKPDEAVLGDAEGNISIVRKKDQKISEKGGAPAKKRPSK